MTVEIIRSETWYSSYDNLGDIQKILDNTLKEYLSITDEILNIEVKERNGMNRFWIYVLKQKTELHGMAKPR